MHGRKQQRPHSLGRFAAGKLRKALPVITIPPATPDTPIPGAPIVGAMRALIRSHDWSNTPLGPVESWSPSLRLIVDTISASAFPMAVRWGPDFVLIYNDGYQPILGDKHPFALGLPFREAWPEVQPRLAALHQDILSGKSPGIFSQDLPLNIRRFGEAFEEARFTVSYSPVPDPTAPSGIGGVLVTAVETTERVRIETALRNAEAALRQSNAELQDEREVVRESEARFRLVAETAPVMLWMGDQSGKCLYLNAAQREFWGLQEADVATFNWNSSLLPDDAEKLYAPFGKAMETQTPFTVEARYRRADGAIRHLHTDARPRFGSGKEFLGMVGVNIDVTEARSAEQAMQNLNATLEQQVAERTAQLRIQEEGLRQAQKMEAVGQLTGGVAHDFNNLLQVIVGNLETLQRNLAPAETRLRRSADNAMNGARRAAVLTQRLLAFSRRQPLDPKPVKVNELVTGMSELLHRSLGETVAVETVLAAGLWRTSADPNQLESALLNLAVNARDAMPAGGKLTIETANSHIDSGYAATQAEVQPGQYVVVCVSDTGVGMDKATLARVFEPFFTTKEPGKGTGLGLSQVYGFVKQSGGHVKVYSEQGEGTTVKIYLPRLMSEADVEEVQPAVTAPEGSREETIMVVEDDDDVRTYSVEILRELGYRVVEAHDSPSALRLLERQPKVDLLFSDVVLPGGWTGAQTAAKAQEMRPGIKVLFTTGYARNAIVHHGRLDAGVQLITKPFTYAELAAKVRDVLDMRPAKP
jgi:PAS domain S-box-containing protein